MILLSVNNFLQNEMNSTPTSKAASRKPRQSKKAPQEKPSPSGSQPSLPGNKMPAQKNQQKLPIQPAPPAAPVIKPPVTQPRQKALATKKPSVLRSPVLKLPVDKALPSSVQRKSSASPNRVAVAVKDEKKVDLSFVMFRFYLLLF